MYIDTNIVEIAFICAFVFVSVVILYGVFFKPVRVRKKGARLTRRKENPVLRPDPDAAFENRAVFNPGAVIVDGKIHLFYRALGDDGISRIGYAVSEDGIHFKKEKEPVFVLPITREQAFRNPFISGLSYNPTVHASGGGWGGAEDPRAVVIDGKLHLTFTIFENWQSIRMAVSTLSLSDLKQRAWRWSKEIRMSPENETHKNWTLFPEKIRGKFAILHALTPQVYVDYVDTLEELEARPIRSHNHRSGYSGHWDAFIRGVAAPPVKTENGWLLFYHAMDPGNGAGYKLGAMLLDLDDPTKILCRSSEPVLEPKEWYENDWKPGVIYATGVIIKNGKLFVYYGGGDKTVNVATAPLRSFLHALLEEKKAALNTVRGTSES